MSFGVRFFRSTTSLRIVSVTVHFYLSGMPLMCTAPPGAGINLQVRDAEALAPAVTDSLLNGGTYLDDYERERRASANQVLDQTDRQTRAATLKPPTPGWLRDRLLTYAGQSPAISKRIAQMLAGYA
jgi:2-polyprenyl-6-methoxyphenol hydroxylase-like FAD-dependent oxidoreductase